MPPTTNLSHSIHLCFVFSSLSLHLSLSLLFMRPHTHTVSLTLSLFLSHAHTHSLSSLPLDDVYDAKIIGFSVWKKGFGLDSTDNFKTSGETSLRRKGATFVKKSSIFSSWWIICKKYTLRNSHVGWKSFHRSDNSSYVENTLNISDKWQHWLLWQFNGYKKP